MSEATQTIPTRNHRFKDKTGQRFGRLAVVGLARMERGQSVWSCQCDCGNKIEVAITGLSTNGTKSCGCLQIEAIRKIRLTHGQSIGKRTPEYGCWVGIKKRCTNTRAKEAVNYVDRGIKMCGRWINSFPNFLADMGPRPSTKHSIDRINNDGDYEPSNCRWATKDVQNNNQRSNISLLIGGEAMTISQLAKKTGRSYMEIWKNHRKMNSVDFQIMVNNVKR